MDKASNTAAVGHAALRFSGLHFADYRLYMFLMALVALDIALPNIFHHLGALGPSLLPMQFIILLTGLTLGWRAGLLAGMLSPVISYLVSGMPLAALLTQLTLENMAYGFTAGFLREKFGLGIFRSLIMSMLGGRLILLLGVSLIYLGQPLPAPSVMPWVSGILPAMNSPLAYLAAATLQGLPGLAAQILFIPSAVKVADRWLQKA